MTVKTVFGEEKYHNFALVFPEVKYKRWKKKSKDANPFKNW